MRQGIFIALLCVGMAVFAAPTHTISGYVRTGAGTGVQGVNITGDNGVGSSGTAADGSYSITVPNHWSGTITATKTGFLLTPPSRTYTSVSEDRPNEDYAAYRPKISGTVTQSDGTPLAGVTITANNSGGTATINASGYYELSIPYNWSGTLTASLSGYGFTAETYTNVITDQPNQDFTAFQPTISGSTGVAGVTVTASGVGSVISTPAYSVTVPFGWTGTVTVQKFKWRITPVSYSYVDLVENCPDQNFNAAYWGIIVKADGSGDCQTIQAAIDVAVDADTINLQPGTYTGNGNRDIDFKGKAITLKGGTGDPNDIVIDCQANTDGRHRGFKFVTGENASSILEAIKITNGFGPNEDWGQGSMDSVGGAIYCEGSRPTITNCVFVDNYADFGGGAIFNTSASPSIRNCEIAGNSARAGGGIFNGSSSNPVIDNCLINNNSTPSGVGGGIYNSYSSPVIINCIINGNSAASFNGGGIVNYYGSPTIRDCVISENSSAHYGGGILNDYSNANIISCDIRDNSAVSNDGGGGIHNRYCNPNIDGCMIRNNLAGGIYNVFASANINNCTIMGNSAFTAGGGIYNYGDSSPIISNCKIISNAAFDGGGIYKNPDSHPIISNCTIVNNYSESLGGGICGPGGSMRVTNCTIYGNYAGVRGGGICAWSSPLAGYPKVTNCIVWGNNPSQIYGDTRFQLGFSDIEGGWTGWGSANIDADPCFIDPNGPDGIIGTEDDNLHFLGSSQCIDKGNNRDVELVGITTDLDGRNRFADGDCNDTNIVDIGAYEFTYAYLGDFDYDCSIDFRDYAILAASWQQNDSLRNIAPPNNIVDIEDLAVFCDNWLNEFN